ncbi:cobalamin biosynthesis protein [Streptomyces sp. NPDC058045]|uniref:cobalamin biosynthesis protein n=1 Tax=Streptomyces sp. NPDC058045 TaxID=3346311 RepID=UPI0036E95A3C
MPFRDLVVGVGAARGVAAGELYGLVLRVLHGAGLAPAAVAELATLRERAAEPGLTAAAARLGVPLAAYPAEVLARVAVPHPSTAVRAAVGTASVAEAAALARGGTLLVAKTRSPRATCAVARLAAAEGDDR